MMDSIVLDWIRATADFNESFSQPDAAYVLEHGHFFTPAPAPEGFERGRPRACYVNVLDFVQTQEAYRYCEGWAIPGGGGPPVQHAWATISGAEALELTWDSPGSEYFGVEIPHDQLHDAVMATSDAFGPVVSWLASGGAAGVDTGS